MRESLRQTTKQSTSHEWVAYAASAWWLSFAAMSFYWAAGGTIGLATLGERIEGLAAARELWFVTLVWVSGVLKLIPGVFVLALVRPWGRHVPRTVLLIMVWAIGVALLVYGGMNMVMQGLVMGGILTPDNVDWTGFTWRLIFWNPWWFLGGSLYCTAAWNYQRVPSKQRRTEVRA